MLTPHIKDDLLKRLRYIRETGPQNPGLGICNNTCIYNHPEDKWMRSVVSDWIKFSGDRSYPVPSDSAAFDAEDLFWVTDNMWDRNTQYGRDRWELLDFLIEQLQKEMAEQ